MATEQEQFERIAMPHLRALLRVARRLASEPAPPKTWCKRPCCSPGAGSTGSSPARMHARGCSGFCSMRFTAKAARAR